MKTKRLTLTAMLTGIALIVFIVESQIPLPIAVPGIKLGLANAVTLFALAVLGGREAFAVLCLRLTIGSIFAGGINTLVYSAAGGLLSFAVMYVLLKLLKQELLWAVSAFGAAAHNIGQLAAAWVMTGSAAVFAYLPVLILAGIASGIFTGLCAYYVVKHKGALWNI